MFWALALRCRCRRVARDVIFIAVNYGKAEGWIQRPKLRVHKDLQRVKTFPVPREEANKRLQNYKWSEPRRRSWRRNTQLPTFAPNFRRLQYGGESRRTSYAQSVQGDDSHASRPSSKERDSTNESQGRGERDQAITKDETILSWIGRSYSYQAIN